MSRCLAPLSAAPLAMLVAAAATGCPSPDRSDAVTGTFLTVMNTSNEIGYLLRRDAVASGDGEYVQLALDEPTRATSRAISGRHVEVTGSWNPDGSLAVTDIAPAEATDDGEPRTAVAQLARGNRRVLVLRVTFDGGTTMGTAQQVTDVMTRAVNFLAAASFNQLQVGYDVAGPFDVHFNVCNDYSRWLGEAKTRAAAAGFNLAGYQHFMLFGNMNCGYGGLGAQPGSETWIAGLWPEVVVHELGHNFGLWHASSRTCTASNVAVPMSDSCTFAEYGDPYDPMGSGGLHHYSASYKSRLGWLPPDQIRTASGDQSYTLAPITAASAGLQLLELKGPNDVYYHLEHRQSSATDSYAGNDPATQGVLVRAFFTAASDAGRSHLLDMVPGSNFRAAALLPGTAYTFYGTGATITVQSVTSAGARVKITGAGAAVGERWRLLHSGKCLGLEAGAGDNLTSIVQRPCNGASDQDWLLADAGGGAYQVRNATANRCLDVLNASTADNTRLILWDCTTGANQKWTLVASGAGQVLRAGHSGKCAGVAGADTADGAALVQLPCADVASQQFRRGGGERLIADHSQQCLAVDGASTADLAAIVQRACGNGSTAPAAGEWVFETLGNSAFALRNTLTGKCLDVVGASTADGAAVGQWPCNGEANQTWQLVASGGGFSLRAAHSGKCLDVYNTSTADGAKLVQWACNGQPNQHFTRR